MVVIVLKCEYSGLKMEESVPSGAVCCFCLTTYEDEALYGKFYKIEEITTHYFCLLLSSKVQQRGSDNEGILGFLPGDIRNEVRRGKNLTCTYCGKRGATLSCHQSKCKINFHLPCGRTKETFHQFFGEFKSFCCKHRKSQRIKAEVLKAMSGKQSTCSICLESVPATPSPGTLWAPCCSKDAWFHRICIQRLALSAGYFFKCPLCNNTTQFIESMRTYGIWIPEQDASWERDPERYEGLLQRHDSCDAKSCRCKNGRTHHVADTRWEIKLCAHCGSQGMHVQCGNLRLSQDWICSVCSNVSATRDVHNTTGKISRSREALLSRNRERRGLPLRPPQRVTRQRRPPGDDGGEREEDVGNVPHSIHSKSEISTLKTDNEASSTPQKDASPLQVPTEVSNSQPKEEKSAGRQPTPEDENSDVEILENSDDEIQDRGTKKNGPLLCNCKWSRNTQFRSTQSSSPVLCGYCCDWAREYIHISKPSSATAIKTPQNLLSRFLSTLTGMPGPSLGKGEPLCQLWVIHYHSRKGNRASRSNSSNRASHSGSSNRPSQSSSSNQASPSQSSNQAFQSPSSNRASRSRSSNQTSLLQNPKQACQTKSSNQTSPLQSAKRARSTSPKCAHRSTSPKRLTRSKSTKRATRSTSPKKGTQSKSPKRPWRSTSPKRETLTRCSNQATDTCVSKVPSALFEKPRTRSQSISSGCEKPAFNYSISSQISSRNRPSSEVSCVRQLSMCQSILSSNELKTSMHTYQNQEDSQGKRKRSITPGNLNNKRREKCSQVNKTSRVISSRHSVRRTRSQTANSASSTESKLPTHNAKDGQFSHNAKIPKDGNIWAMANLPQFQPIVILTRFQGFKNVSRRETVERDRLCQRGRSRREQFALQKQLKANNNASRLRREEHDSHHTRNGSEQMQNRSASQNKSLRERSPVRTRSRSRSLGEDVKNQRSSHNHENVNGSNCIKNKVKETVLLNNIPQIVIPGRSIAGSPFAVSSSDETDDEIMVGEEALDETIASISEFGTFLTRSSDETDDEIEDEIEVGEENLNDTIASISKLGAITYEEDCSSYVIASNSSCSRSFSNDASSFYGEKDSIISLPASLESSSSSSGSSSIITDPSPLNSSESSCTSPESPSSFSPQCSPTSSPQSCLTLSHDSSLSLLTPPFPSILIEPATDSQNLPGTVIKPSEFRNKLSHPKHMSDISSPLVKTQLPSTANSQSTNSLSSVTNVPLRRSSRRSFSPRDTVVPSTSRASRRIHSDVCSEMAMRGSSPPPIFPNRSGSLTELECRIKARALTARKFVPMSPAATQQRAMMRYLQGRR